MLTIDNFIKGPLSRLQKEGDFLALFQKLDLWSIMEELEKMTDYYMDGNEKESLYWDFYSD